MTTDRYVFLRTAENDGQVVALIGDKQVLGDAGVSSLRNAFTAHAAPKMRAGILTLTASQLQERIPLLQEQGMSQSAAAYQRAIECIHKKNGVAPTVTASASPSPPRNR